MDNQEQNGLGMNPVNQEPVMQPTEPQQAAPVDMPAPVEQPQVPVETAPPVVEAVPVEQASVEPTVSEPVAPTTDVTPQVQNPVDTVTPIPNGGDKGNKVFIGIVVALVLIIAILGIFILTKGGKSGSGSITTTTTTEETFTKDNTTTNVNNNSTTRQIYNNVNNYTTSTRANNPTSVKQSGSVLKVDNYEYNLTGGDMVVYTAEGQDFIYDTKDDAEIIVDIYNGKSTNDVIPSLQELANKRYEQGYNVVEGNYGTLYGVSICYLLLQDNKFLYYEFYLDTGYGDLARYTFLSKKQYTVDSVAKLLYTLNSVAVKKNSGTASAGLGDSLPTNYFDENLLSE